MTLTLKRPYTYLDAISDRFRVLYEGKTYGEIADLAGVSKNTVQLILGPSLHNPSTDVLVRMVDGAGIDMTGFFEQIEYKDPEEEEVPSTRAVRYSEGTKREAVAAFYRGRTLASIAEGIGCLPATVSVWVRKNKSDKKGA